LLNAVLNPPVRIESVEVLPTQPEKLAVGDKNISLDVRVLLENGEQIDVEMQSQRRPALRERTLYYWARLYTGQLERGDPYTALRRCVVVLITDFAELTSLRFHSVFQINEQHGWERLTGHLEIHLVELPKVADAQNDEQDLTLWGKFLSARADEELEQLAMESPVLKQAKAALDRLSADDVTRMQAQQREMALLSYEAGLAAAREEAEQQGRQEGRIEERTKLLLRLLTLKFGAQPASTAERLAHASDAELSCWFDRALTVETFEEVFV
jgi:predicted transposase/invertase (TIGR01784 family)